MGGYWIGIIIINVVVAALSIALAYMSSHQWYGWRLLMALLYIDIYFYSKRHDELKAKSIYGLIMIAIAIIIRLLGKAYFDDTIAYNTFIAGITHCVLALGICIVVYAFVSTYMREKKISKAVVWLDSISYEVYLVHYMFVVGPCKIDMLPAYWLNILFAIVISFLFAIMLHHIVSWIGRKPIGGNEHRR